VREVEEIVGPGLDFFMDACGFAFAIIAGAAGGGADLTLVLSMESGGCICGLTTCAGGGGGGSTCASFTCTSGGTGTDTDTDTGTGDGTGTGTGTGAIAGTAAGSFWTNAFPLLRPIFISVSPLPVSKGLLYCLFLGLLLAASILDLVRPIFFTCVFLLFVLTESMLERFFFTPLEIGGTLAVVMPVSVIISI
jgi:hypothetical protein